MIGIVLAAHGPLSGAFLESTSMILGDLPQVASIALMPGDSLEGLADRLQAAVNEVNTGDGVLILLDMFGGSDSKSNGSPASASGARGGVTINGVNINLDADLLEALKTPRMLYLWQGQ